MAFMKTLLSYSSLLAVSGLLLRLLPTLAARCDFRLINGNWAWQLLHRISNLLQLVRPTSYDHLEPVVFRCVQELLPVFPIQLSCH